MCVNLNIFEKHTHTLVRNSLKAVAILAKKKEQRKLASWSFQLQLKIIFLDHIWNTIQEEIYSVYPEWF